MDVVSVWLDGASTNWVIVLVLVIPAILGMLVLGNAAQSRRDATPEEACYKASGPLFSPAERSFLGILELAAGDKVKIYGKVRLADILQPDSPGSRSKWQSAFNRISSKHVDYLICKADDLSVLGVIELNDKSHRQRSRKARDEFVEQALQSAGIPLLQIDAQREYQVETLRQLLQAIVPSEECSD